MLDDSAGRMPPAIVRYFREFRKNQLRAVMQEFRKLVIDANASDASAEYGGMLTQLENQLAAVNAINLSHTRMIKGNQTTIEHASQVAQERRDIGAKRLRMRIVRNSKTIA